MPIRIEFTPGVQPAVRALHMLAFGSELTESQDRAYADMIRQALMNFEDRYRSIAFFWANAVHAFEAVSISGPGDRYPRHTLSLVFIRRSHSDYIVSTPNEVPLPTTYADMRLIEEVRHIYSSLPDLPPHVD